MGQQPVRRPPQVVRNGVGGAGYGLGLWAHGTIGACETHEIREPYEPHHKAGRPREHVRLARILKGGLVEQPNKGTC